MSSLNLFKNGQFPILRVPLYLGEYHEDLMDNMVDVWVNISRDLAIRRIEYAAAVGKIAEAAEDKETAILTPELVEERAAIYAEIWDLPIEETRELFGNVGAFGLVTWMRERTEKLIEEYGGRRAKVVSG